MSTYLNSFQLRHEATASIKQSIRQAVDVNVNVALDLKLIYTPCKPSHCHYHSQSFEDYLHMTITITSFVSPQNEKSKQFAKGQCGVKTDEALVRRNKNTC